MARATLQEDSAAASPCTNGPTPISHSKRADVLGSNQHPLHLPSRCLPLPVLEPLWTACPHAVAVCLCRRIAQALPQTHYCMLSILIWRLNYDQCCPRLVSLEKGGERFASCSSLSLSDITWHRVAMTLAGRLIALCRGLLLWVCLVITHGAHSDGIVTYSLLPLQCCQDLL